MGFRRARPAVPAVVPAHCVARAGFRFHRMLPEFVWDGGVLGTQAGLAPAAYLRPVAGGRCAAGAPARPARVS